MQQQSTTININLVANESQQKPVIMKVEKGTSRCVLRLAEALTILVCCAAHFTIEGTAAPVISTTDVVLSSAIGSFTNGGTISPTSLPKCGVNDEVESKIGARSKRYVTVKGPKWEHKSLTYKIKNYPKNLGRTEVDEVIAKAFAVWSEYTDLTFTKKSGPVDIHISFESGAHGDYTDFDGLGGSLAHASSPVPEWEAIVHFDDDEDWTIDSYSGTDLFKVAVHEFGHTLGLSHSDEESSIMWAYVGGYDPNFKLDNDDITGIQSLYGPKTGYGDPQICNDPKIDTVFYGPEENIFVFKGKYYWKLTKEGTAPGYPKLITETWEGLPSDIDAAFTQNDLTYFFKGSMYWVYSEEQMEGGYPRRISEDFPGVPANIDTVAVSNEYGKIFFFKGTKFWKIDSALKLPSKRSYPTPISQWQGLPKNLDATLNYDGYTYLFKNEVYYRFDQRTLSMDTASPSETKTRWFGCLSDRVERKSRKNYRRYFYRQ